jgi:hypothetical protein
MSDRASRHSRGASLGNLATPEKAREKSPGGAKVWYKDEVEGLGEGTSAPQESRNPFTAGGIPAIEFSLIVSDRGRDAGYVIQCRGARIIWDWGEQGALVVKEHGVGVKCMLSLFMIDGTSRIYALR